jgi:AGZA family xanthine/uracil permease-like MFS transporter
MGENAFIAFGLVALGATWEQRLGSVFVAGVIFLLLTLFQVRSKLANAISPSLKYSFAAGIGLFLAFIGLYETGIVTSGAAGLPPAALLNSTGPQLLHAPDVPLKIGAFHDFRVLLAIAGFVAIAALMIRRVPGAILIGMGATAAAGYAIGLGPMAPPELVWMPFTGAYSLSPIALQLDVAGVLTVSFLPVLLTLVLMSFLDTLGTLVGVGAAGDMLDKDGNFPQVEKPMLVDAVTCMFASLVGTSTSGAYIESATGIREGARTGLAAVVTALLFLASLFLLPIVALLQGSQYIYGPALVAVGMLMVGSARKIDFDDLTEAVPAFACIALMVFTYNIANGLTAGLVLYPVGKIVAGRARELNWGHVSLGALCLTYFLFGLPH